MSPSSFTPTHAAFYDSETISALVMHHYGHIWSDEVAGRITAEQARERAQAVHETALGLRAELGLIESCAGCNDPIEGTPWRNSWPWSQEPYCTPGCSEDHAERQAAS